MAITKEDCITLLFDIGTDEAKKKISELVRVREPSNDILKFIYQSKGLDCRNFYEKLRKAYNDKKSKLYKNIMFAELDSKEVLCCLGSLGQQILLFNKTVESNNQIFLRQVRLDEIYKALLNFYNTGDIIPCQKLLKIFKLDIMCLEQIAEDSKKEEEL